MSENAFVTLQLGQSGQAVAVLQARLTQAGFLPGRADGWFGPATEAAVEAFQHAHDLLPDGAAGPRTQAILAAAAAPSVPTKAIDLSIVCRMFPDTGEAAIARNLPGVLVSLTVAGLSSPVASLAALATIRAEAECFEPIAEAVSGYNTSRHGHAFDLYDRRSELGNLGPPDGAKFRGRGYVQLTGRRNYGVFGRRVGADLVAEPSLACDPAIAAKLLAAFIAAEAPAIEAALTAGAFSRARRLVNGGTHGLQRFTDAYRAGAAALGLQH